MHQAVVKLTHFMQDARRVVPVAENALLLFLWIWLYRPIYPYLKTIFTKEEFRTNQIVLLAILVLIAVQMRKGDLRLRLASLPQFYPASLAMVLLGSGLFLLSERYLDVNTLSASLFGLASYGLLGLWMDSQRWRQGLPAALLLVSALPFGDHMQTFIGYPVRIMTATAVRAGLAMMGVPSISIDTILVFENGISQVDLPCSGVKSLWTGGIFLLSATWVERRSLNLRWLCIAMAFVFLLLAANLGRVAILVVVGQVAGWRLMAEMLHVPSGVIGFAAACAAATWMLRQAGKPVGHDEHVEALDSDSIRGAQVPGSRVSTLRPAWLAPTLAAVLLALVFLYTPRPQSVSAQSQPGWIFPAALKTEPWPLTPQESEWLSSVGVEKAERWRFQWRGETGSMLLVSSTTWRAHHRPERCFEVYGLTINNSHAYLAAPDFPVRILALGKDRQRDLLSAAYWFQSPEQATDDYAVRMWADLAPERQRWVLVTVLFDDATNPVDSESLALYDVLRQSVNQGLKGVSQP